MSKQEDLLREIYLLRELHDDDRTLEDLEAAYATVMSEVQTALYEIENKMAQDEKDNPCEICKGRRYVGGSKCPACNDH